MVIRRFGFVWLILATAVAVVLPSRLKAQSPEESAIPQSVEPSRPQQNIEAPLEPKSRPHAVVPLQRKRAIPEDAAQLQFVFRELHLEGMTALDRNDLLAIWRFRPGETASVADIFSFANRVTQAYSDAGYPLSFAVVPEQEIRNGIIRLRVIEGFISEIEIVGDAGVDSPLHRRIMAIGERVLASKPLRLDDLERGMLLIEDLPGVGASGILMPSSSVTGGSLLQIEVDHQSVSVVASLSNSMPASLDRYVAGGLVSLNGTISGSEEIRLGAWRSMTSSAYWSVRGDFSTTVGVDGWRLGATGVYSKTTPTDELLSSLRYEGRSVLGRVSVEYPAIRTRAENLSIGISAVLQNSDSDILDDSLVHDRLRYGQIFAHYDYADSNRAVTSLRATMQQGAGILGATGDSRATGDHAFTTLALEGDYARPLFNLAEGLVSSRLSVFAHATPGGTGLFSPLECGYGGARFGGAWEAGFILGEHCLLGKLETSWTGSASKDLDFGIYGFVDGGGVWQKGSLEFDERRFRAASSLGGGVRFNLPLVNVSGFLEYAHGLSVPDDIEDGDDFRVLTGLTAAY